MFFTTHLRKAMFREELADSELLSLEHIAYVIKSPFFRRSYDFVVRTRAQLARHRNGYLVIKGNTSLIMKHCAINPCLGHEIEFDNDRETPNTSSSF